MRTNSLMKSVVLSIIVASIGFPIGADADTREEIPIQAWIHDPVIASVDVSPDGNRLVALTLSDVNQAPDITVWDVRDLSSPPIRFRPDDSKALVVEWLNNERLFVVGRQKFDYRIGGKVTKWFRDKAYIYNWNGEGEAGILENRESIGLSILDTLPQDHEKILVSLTNLEFAEDIYEVDLNSLISRRVYRGATGESFITDSFGEIRGKTEIKGRGDDVRIEYSYLHPGTGEWELHHALYAAKREGMQPVAFGPDGRTVYMTDNTGRDRKVIRPYDLITRELGTPVFDDSTIEATNVVVSRQPEDFGKVVGYAGWGAGIYRQYTDAEWESIQRRIDEALPGNRLNVISSISDDFSVAVVTSSGPREPTAYFLFRNGRELISLGREYPYLEPEKLAEMKYVTYEARDGMPIPAFLTVPNGEEAPFPAVVIPHGGPWARDFLSWDPFAQFLANRGYVVLQPQYRGSDGWGQELWRAGDREWGFKMQDDKDDGAKWLVEQGLTAKDRIAMFGYSYGGYAAMAAIVRTNPPYQCAIAGAGLSDLTYFDKVTFEGEYQREFQNPTIRGLSPLDEAEKASIPIYIFHGDRDQRVPIEQSRNFYSALKRNDKDVKYEEIVDLWHSFPWFPQHKLAILQSIEDYLANDCGPGGL